MKQEKVTQNLIQLQKKEKEKNIFLWYNANLFIPFVQVTFLLF